MASLFATRFNDAFEKSAYAGSQAALAKAAGTSKGQVSQWLKGMVKAEKVKADVLERLSQSLQVRPRWLLYGEEPMRWEDAKPGLRVTDLTPEYSAWVAYNGADSKTRAVVDLLLLPSRERSAAVKGNKSLELAINVLEAEVVNARKSPNAATAAAGVV